MALRTETTIESIRAAVALLPKKDQALPPELEHRRAIGLRLTEIANFHPSTAGLDSLDPDDLDQFLDGYLEAYTRAEAARRMLSSGAQDALKRGYRHHLNTYVPTLLAKLEPIVNTASATLTDAAKSLPAGDAALDGAAVLEAGATDAYQAATEALAVLTTAAGVLVPRVDPELKIARKEGHAAAAIIAPPSDTTPTRMGTYNRRPVDPREADRNRAVAAVVPAWQASHALTLLAVARGEHGPCTISLAMNQAEADHRATLLHTAGEVRIIDDRPSDDAIAARKREREAQAAGILLAGNHPSTR